MKFTTEIDYVEQIKGNSTPLGQVTLEILNPKNTEVSEADFIGVPNDFSCLLGLKPAQEMGLFTINKENLIPEVTGDTSQLGNLAKQSCTLIQMLHHEHYPTKTFHLHSKRMSKMNWTD